MNTSVGRHAARFLLSIAASLAALPGLAQVTQFSTGAVEVRAFLARSATNVYAASHGGGLFRSTDAGANWTRIALPNNEHYLTSLAGNSTTTMVVGSEEGLMTSTDGVGFVVRISEPVSAVAMGPLGSTTVLAAVRGLGILRSINSGVTFTLATNTGLAGTDILAIAEDPTNANTFYLSAKPDGQGNNGGIYKSTDIGQTWTLSTAIPNGGSVVNAFGLAVDSAGNVYAAVNYNNGQGGLFKQTGGAGAWVQGGNSFTAISVHRDANVGTTMWGGQRVLGLRRTTNGGTSWTDAFPGGTADPNFFYTAINTVVTMPGNNTIAMKAIKGAGVWRSTNANGATPTWTRVVFPGADRMLSASHVAGNPSSILFGLHAGGVWRSNTAGNASSTFFPPTVNGAVQADFAFGTSATSVHPFVSIWDIAASASNPNWIWVAAGNVGMHYGNDTPGIWRFNGAAWQGIASCCASGAPYNIVAESGNVFLGDPTSPVYSVEILSGDDNTVFASYLGANYGISRRVAGGAWSFRGVPAVTPQVRSVVSAAGGNNNRAIALPFDDKPVKSEDFGATFAAVTANQMGFERLRFFQVAENPLLPVNWIGATSKGIYFSNDNGATWTRSTSGGLLSQAMSAVGYKPSTGRAFAGDRAGNRYCSSDGGSSWTRLTTGVPNFNAAVNSIRVVNGQLYYMTDGAGAMREDGSC